MDSKRLQIEQLEDRIKVLVELRKLSTPPTGWVKAIRTSLGMTLLQLASKLGITKNSARQIEVREQEGSITLKSLREAANAIDMDLVYGFVPRDGSLEKYIDRKARELATEIVMRTSSSMKLEDQENEEDRIEKAIEERTEVIKRELPKALWD